MGAGHGGGGRVAAIIGAGPAGLLLGPMLRQFGIDVPVPERRDRGPSGAG